MKKLVEASKCPNCSGRLEMSEDGLKMICPYCSSEFDLVDDEEEKKVDKAAKEECLNLKYPYYDGMDKKTYESFLLFLINKYETIKSYLPDDSDRLPVIKKELAIMNEAYNRFAKLNK